MAAYRRGVMATKKLSGKGLAADVRSGMDCVALTEKHDLSVAELKKALAAIVTRGVLSQNELPAWLAEEKPWKCPKCGRGQSERFERCPVCGVIISKLRKGPSEASPKPLSKSSPPPIPEFSKWQSGPAKSPVSGMAKVIAIGAVALLVIGLGWKLTSRQSEPPIRPAARQTETPQAPATVPEVGPSQETTRPASQWHPSEEAILKNRKAQRIAKLAQDYERTHTYSREDMFACVDMSVDMWNQIQTAGIRAGLMAGNVATDITGLRGENMPQYVAQMNHAWVVAEIEPGLWLPVEATAGAIVNPLAPNYSLYFSGEFFTNPREFKAFEELRRHLFKNCMEAHQMADSFRSLVQNRPETKEEVLEAYRARGQLDQRARDCREHFERIQQVLNSRGEMIVPWVTHWGQ
jgi:hypothetical protein